MGYEVRTTVGGKVAQLGGCLIDGVAKRYADVLLLGYRMNSTEPMRLESLRSCGRLAGSPAAHTFKALLGPTRL